MATRDPNARVIRWLKKVQREAAGVILEARDPGKPREAVTDIPLGDKAAPEVLAADIMQRAQEEAEGSGNGTHEFALLAYRDKERSPFDSFRFMVLATGAPERVNPSGAADRSEFLAQSHQHIEALTRALQAKDALIVEGFGALLSTMQTRNELYERSQREFFENLKSLVTSQAQHAEDLEDRRAHRELMEKIAGVAIAVAPAIAKKLGLIEGEKPEPEPEPEPSATVVQIPAHLPVHRKR